MTTRIDLQNLALEADFDAKKSEKDPIKKVIWQCSAWNILKAWRFQKA
jgi:hypothetical protein